MTHTVVAYETETGRILQVHHSLHAPLVEDDVQADAAKGRGVPHASVATIAVNSSAMQPGRHYRVDPATRQLVEAPAGTAGHCGAVGLHRPQS